MSTYVAPLKDFEFVLNELVRAEELCKLPGCADAQPETAVAMLEAAAIFGQEVLAPLNAPGDREGVRWQDGKVRTPAGFQSAYRQFVNDGWHSLAASSVYGGQGAPLAIAAPISEIWQAANIALGGCATLTGGAIRAIELCGSEELKRRFLPPLVQGTWTGTMNLTEPQSGSDLSTIKTRAIKAADGTYRLFGQKIFISWGEHDLTENIIHLVLARTDGTPAGIKGLSLFLVPKRLVEADGSLGSVNDVRCIALEHKIGQHAAPNTVLAFGAAPGSETSISGAVGYLVGEECRGVENMFIMMNDARLGVGIEGIALSERAYQAAVSYARERIQGSEAGSAANGKVPIIRHPDIRRMLLWMRSHTEAARILSMMVAARMDTVRCHPDAGERKAASQFIDLMMPIVKGWSTENAVQITSLCLQVHGGSGYMEKTGVGQYWRDARLLAIYEGTTGIQANDLVLRKIAKDNGSVIRGTCEQMRECACSVALADDKLLDSISKGLLDGVVAIERSVAFIVANARVDVRSVLAGAVPFLHLFGTVTGAWMLCKAAAAARRRASLPGADRRFLEAKVITAYFYAKNVVPASLGLADTIINGAPDMQLSEELAF